MAHQSVLPRGKSWSAGSATGSLPSSSTTLWVNSKRLKKQDQDARASYGEMKDLELEIHELSTTLEKLEKFDAKRVARLRELGGDGEEVNDVKKENFDTQDAEGLNREGEGVEHGKGPQGERSSEGDWNDEVESLRSERHSTRSQIEYTKGSLARKRADLEILAGQHQTLTDLIAKEEKHAQVADIEESLQQSVAVQQEMRSLSEDLGRLGRLMEGLKEANAEPLKQNSHPQLKPRMYHPVTQFRSKNHKVSKNEGAAAGASDLGRSASVGDGSMGSSGVKEPSRLRERIRSKEPSRIKELAEFEQREGGGNRKRQKSSSFELERERLNEERAKLDVEAREKKRLLDSLSSFSSQPQSSKGASAAQGPSASRRESSSPSSLFEGYAETPLGLGTGGSTVLMSDSSESSEFSTEKLDPNSIASAVKRLDFESVLKEDSPSTEVISPPVDNASKPSYVEVLRKNSVDDNADIGRPQSREQLKLSALGNGEECFSSENGNEEFQLPAVNSSKNTWEEILSTEGVSSVSGIEYLSPEVEGKRVSEVSISQSAPPEDEIHQSLSEVARFQSEGLESLSEGFGDLVRDAGEERTLEETESNGLHDAPKDEVEEIDIPNEELDSFRDAAGGGEEEHISREEEVVTTGNRAEEIEIPEEDIEDFEIVEHAEKTSDQLISKETAIDDVERLLKTESEISAYDDGEDTITESVTVTQAQAPELQENGFKYLEPVRSGLLSPPVIGHSNDGDMSGERHNRRLEAENQMMQLSSQLSLLQKQVEDEFEVHEKSKPDSRHECSIAEKEQLVRQVSSFAEEVRGLRQNIDEIQHILHNEGELSVVEHWAKDLHSKCADQSAQLEHLGKQVSMLGKYLKHHLEVSVDIDNKLEKEFQERHTAETQLTDLSNALAMTVSTMEKEEESLGEVIQYQKHLLADQLKEAEKLRHIAEVRVLTLNSQIEQLEMVCDAAKSIQAVTKYQEKAFRYGLQTLMQLFLLAVGVITLYSRVAEPARGPVIPT